MSGNLPLKMVHGRNEDDTDCGDFVSGPPRKQAKVLSKACESCKLKKAGCDSSRPTCRRCQQKGLDCVYKERGQPGLRRGYGKAVENRLSTLEDNIEKISRSVQDVLKHFQAQVPLHRPCFNTPGSDHQPGPQLALQNTSPSDNDNAWQPENGPAPLTAVYSDGVQPTIEAASFTGSPSPVNALAASLSMPTIPKALDVSLPPEYIMYELVDLFFEHISPWVLLFHQPTFKASMFSQSRQILLHGVVVLAFRFWTKAEPSLQLREAYVKTSRERLLLETIDVTSLTSTQAVAMLAVDALAQGPGPRSWNIMAILVTSAQQLRLARSDCSKETSKQSPLVDNNDPKVDISQSAIETEEKRRLFWTIYSLDRFSSIPHAQPAAIDSRTIILQYPTADDSWGQNTSPEWFQRTSSTKPSLARYPVNTWHYYIDILTLLDQSNQLLVQPVNLSLPAHCQEWQSNFRRMDIAFATWFENLPVEMREYPRVFDPIWTLVHATFYLINIRMYTVAAFPSTTSPYFRPSSSARGRCRQAIRSVSGLVASLEPHQISQLGPMFAFIVWVAARSLVIIWTSGHETTCGAMPPSDLDSLLRALRQSAERWPCAQRHVDIIQLILDTKNNPEGPTGLDIFNDTKKTAYGLQSRLGALAGLRMTADKLPYSDDFLDGAFPEIPDLSGSYFGLGGFEPEFGGDWL